MIVKVSASDDVNPGNDTGRSGGISVVAPPVDYAVSTVTAPATAVAGSPLSGSFTLQNIGTQAGTQAVYWDAYVSTDSVFDASAKLVAAGTNAPLAAGASQSGIAISGTWPTTPSTYYLIVTISAGDDVDASNNSAASGSVSVTAPDIDYTPASITDTSPDMAGGTLSGTFTAKNVGTEAGVQPVYWSAYESSKNTLDGSTEQLVAAGSIPALAAGGSQTGVGFAGMWPPEAGTYYLIVSLSASDTSMRGTT